MHKLIVFFALFVSVCSCGDSQENTSDRDKFDSVSILNIETRIEILDAEAMNVIDTSAKIENLAGGYEWTEGPLYIANGDYVLFSDVPANKVFKWKEGEGVSLYLDSSGYSGDNIPKGEPGSNGLLLDQKGNLVLCQHGYRRVAKMDAPLDSPRPAYTAIADNFGGRKLNSPNDAVFHSNGDLYFTDPPYGLDNGTNDSAKQLDHHGVYRGRPGAETELLTGEFEYPNGIALTPDEKFLIVAHSGGSNTGWMKYELDEKGLIKNKSVLYKLTEHDKKLPGAPDGLKISRKGYLFASAPGGIWIFNPNGKLIAKIYTGQATSNCALDKQDQMLYMTCDAFLYRIKLK